MKIREMIAKAKDRIFGKKEPGKETGKDVKESVQKAQEQRKDEKTDFLSQEAEKRQEGEKNDATVLAFRYYCGDLDKWQLEKLKMSNNERRRRGIPMVRRRAYMQAEKNRRRRARKK